MINQTRRWMVIVPTPLHDEIIKRIEVALAGRRATVNDREEIYQILCSAVERTGKIPDFSLEKIR